MGKFRYTYPIFAAAILLFISSCTKEEGNVLPQDSEGTAFVLKTKAGAEEETTFRIMAYGSEQENHFNCISSGTYSIQGKTFEDFPYLTASKLYDDGSIETAEDAAQALAVPYEQVGKNFFIAYVSPGKMHTNGGFITRLSDPFYCSDIQKTVLYNYGKVEMAQELIDRRAKIGFRLYKDKEEKIIEITDFRIVGAGNTYWPATKQVTSDDTLDVTLNVAPQNSDRLIYECKEFDDMEFVLSGIYAPKDTVASHLFKNSAYALGFVPANLQESNYLVAKFNLHVDGSGPLEMTAPLTFNALAKQAVEINPLTTYMYNITVSDTYIHTILEVTPLNSWEEIEFGFEIKDNSLKIDLGNFEFADWEDMPWDNTEIDDPGNNN